MHKLLKHSVWGGGTLSFRQFGYKQLRSGVVSKCFNGFTLAEVLVTLGVIGIVAAMTLPALIADYQKKQTIAQLKEVYSILNQAYQRSVLENGDVETWDWEHVSYAPEFAVHYILQYIGNYNRVKDLSIKYWKSLDGGYDSAASYMNTYPFYYLQNGMSIGFSALDFTNNFVNRNKTHIRINIDINGNKGPNQYGRDVFVFSIFPFSEKSRGKVVPGTNDQCGGGGIHNELSREILTTRGCATCKTDHTGYGYGCAALIMIDGWEIKDDYPW